MALKNIRTELQNAIDADKYPEKPDSGKMGAEIIDNIDDNFNSLSVLSNGSLALLVNSQGLIPNFDSINKTLTIRGFSRFIANGSIYVVRGNDNSPVTSRVIDLSTVENGFVVYKPSDETYKLYAHSSALIDEEELVIASFYNYGEKGNIIGMYTIDGINPITSMPESGYLGLFYHPTVTPNFNSELQRLEIPGGSRFFSKEKGYIIKGDNGSTLTQKNIDLSAVPTGFITYVPDSEHFTVRPHTALAIPDNEILIATYSENGGKANMAGVFSIDGYSPMSEKKEEKILSFNYEEIDITSLFGTVWSDFIIYNGDYLIFHESSDEDHNASDGHIYIVNQGTELLTKTITHNLGHCNTVDYDAVNDILMIGNLPGGTTHPTAIYLIHDFSTLLSLSDIDFNTIDKTIIDLSDSTYPISQIASCFAENNGLNRGIFFVIGNYGSKNMKILAGRGTNDLGLGVFTSNALDKFNGSYKILDTHDYTLQNSASDEVQQGIAYYKGSVYTGNGHSNVEGAITSIDTGDDLVRDKIRMTKYADNGTVIETATEGCAIDSDFLYLGSIASSSRKINKIKL